MVLVTVSPLVQDVLVVKTYGISDPDDRIRAEWGQLLDEHLTTLVVTRKDLRKRLSDIGIEVSDQAIGQWIRGETSPRPSVQAAIAHVLRVPPRSLWPLVYEAA